MAVEFSSLPENIKTKIEELGLKTIRRIIEFHYPSGKVEFGIYGTDYNGWNYAHIFSVEGGELV